MKKELSQNVYPLVLPGKHKLNYRTVGKTEKFRVFLRRIFGLGKIPIVDILFLQIIFGLGKTSSFPPTNKFFQVQIFAVETFSSFCLSGAPERFTIFFALSLPIVTLPSDIRRREKSVYVLRLCTVVNQKIEKKNSGTFSTHFRLPLQE